MARVAEVMTRGVRTMTPTETVMKAAQAMDELDVGAIPVCENDELVGIVTDRDIVLRGVAQGRAPDATPLKDVMSTDTLWCYEDQEVDEVVDVMRDAQVRRMPVVDRQKHLVGILSLGDVATKVDADMSGEALQEISEPSEPNRSHQSAASGAAGGGSASGQARGEGH